MMLIYECFLSGNFFQLCISCILYPHAFQCDTFTYHLSELHFIVSAQILDTNPQLFFHLQQQRLIELIRNGKVEEALEFAQEELAPRGEENVHLGLFSFFFLPMTSSHLLILCNGCVVPVPRPLYVF